MSPLFIYGHADLCPHILPRISKLASVDALKTPLSHVTVGSLPKNKRGDRVAKELWCVLQVRLMAISVATREKD
ncbi:hypothetical protein L596_016105 [Steinernema carpocapsae]|uniref:Uncharacterized protein n=1 Tax=Steinernema carpocapsae TaxID=34508 RepID=A0A4U5NH42_STECR|nr:hypothetical protein L596_016105 [Steinernema carpocapsae]